MGTIVVCIVLAAIVTGIIAYLVRQKKKGLCTGCKHCSSSCPHAQTK